MSQALPTEVVDVVVIGGGPAGLNGALMLARSRRSVVVIDAGAPRNAPAEAVHGLFGLDGTPPAELLARGRDEVRSYGGVIVEGRVVATERSSVSGDPRFTVTLTDGRHLVALRVLVATGVRDVLPDVPGLAAHWGRDVVHCPYCHGWEVRDRAIGVLSAGPMSLHQVWLFRQLSADVVFFTDDELDADTRARLAARDVRVYASSVAEVLGDDGLTGVRLADGQVVARDVLAVATQLKVNDQGLEGLGLPTEDLPGGLGQRFVAGMAGVTPVPGVWVAGNATEPMAQVGASAAAGAMAGSHINADLAAADTDAALTAMEAVSSLAATS